MALAELSSELQTLLLLMEVITNAKSLMSAISWKTKVEMFEIQESEITIIERVTPSNLSAVPGTMKLHQVCQSEHLKYSI